MVSVTLVSSMAALLLVQTGFAVLINQETGEFMSALAAGDSQRFWSAVRWCVLWVCGAVPTYALYYFVRDRLGNHWRRWLTYRFLGRYFSHQKFYELNAHVSIDNPDQRIAEDINTFTQRTLYFLINGNVAALQGAIGAFSAFVPRGLVRQLIGSGNELALGGRSRFLSIMFTDLESFSTWGL